MSFARSGLVLAAIVVSAGTAAFAFSSFEFYGGTYHAQITRAALEPLKLSKESLHWLDMGNTEADKFYGPLFDKKSVHFTDMTFEESADELEDGLDEVIDLAGRAVNDYQMYRRTLVQFGKYLHSTQDFYAHTNWVEGHLVAGATNIPLAPEDFDDLPSWVISPYSLLRQMPPGEVTETQPYEEAFGRPFYSGSELAAMEPRRRISTAAEPRKAFTHHDLAKDNPTYAAGRPRWNSAGRSVFEIALETATRETTRQWRRMESEIADEYEEGAPLILSVLRDGWIASFPASPEPAALSLSRGDLRLRRDLTVEVDFRLEASHWNRAAAQEAIDVFTGLTRPEDEKERYRNEGVTELQLRQDEASKEFRISYRANLYGSARSGARLRPLDEDAEGGRWELRLTLPPGIETVEQLTFWPRTPASMDEEGGNSVRIGPSLDLAGALERRKEVRIILEAPRRGWSPPPWLREYLRDSDA